MFSDNKETVENVLGNLKFGSVKISWLSEKLVSYWKNCKRLRSVLLGIRLLLLELAPNNASINTKSAQ